MPEWWTYSLSDFLLFSPRTYDRLNELYNLAIWPLQLGTACTGVAIIATLARKPLANRVAALLLGLCWAWVAWAFHLERYAQINWAAPWFAIAFALEAALLMSMGLFAGGLSTEGEGSRPALLVALILVVTYPLLAPLTGRPWTAGEVFGTAPDPTALVTLVLVMHGRGAQRWVLAAVPIAWCAVGAATLLAMESAQAYVMIALALAALALPFATRRATPRAR
jgi:hypothetical protein